MRTDKWQMHRIGREGSDCTAPYSIDLLHDITVAEFIKEALKDEREWGYIGIANHGAIFGDPHCEYKYGELLYELDEEYADKKVIYATASGGWSRMDYLLKVE